MITINDIPKSESVLIKNDSEVVSASSVGVGADLNEVRIIIINKKLVNDDENNLKLINESDLQIVMDKTTAKQLQLLLKQYTE